MVITEKKTFFSWHLFFKLPSFLNHLSYRSLIGLKWKIISCSYWWHVSLSVSSSTCPFVGSSDHCLSSHSTNSFGTGKTLLPQWVINPLCHCSCSLALIWDWEWVLGWCVYALFKLREMEQCVDILIPCDDLEINFWQNVFQTNNFLYSLYIIILTIYFWFFNS